jgi:transcriptional regulator with XRE-family HTH domain
VGDVSLDWAELGRRVRGRRELLGLTWFSLGKRSGVDSKYVAEIERGRAQSVSVVVLARLAGALDWDLVSVVSGLEDMSWGSEGELMDLWVELSPAERAFLLAHARGLLRLRGVEVSDPEDVSDPEEA